MYDDVLTRWGYRSCTQTPSHYDTSRDLHALVDCLAYGHGCGGSRMRWRTGRQSPRTQHEAGTQCREAGHSAASSTCSPGAQAGSWRVDGMIRRLGVGIDPFGVGIRALRTTFTEPKQGAISRTANRLEPFRRRRGVESPLRTPIPHPRQVQAPVVCPKTNAC